MSLNGPNPPKTEMGSKQAEMSRNLPKFSKTSTTIILVFWKFLQVSAHFGLFRADFSGLFEPSNGLYLCIYKIVAVLETTCNGLSNPPIAYEINFRNSKIGRSQNMALIITYFVKITENILKVLKKEPKLEEV